MSGGAIQPGANWLSRAPIQHQFRRPEDLLSWMSQFLKLADYSHSTSSSSFQSCHRVLPLGQIQLAANHYNTSVRVEAECGQLMFNLNTGGDTLWRVDRTCVQSKANDGAWIVTGPGHGSWVKQRGGGLAITAPSRTLLRTCQAMYGKAAVRQLALRLRQPILACPPQGGSRGLLHSLQLLDGLIDSHGGVPAALALDDLICRQLVLMLMPELQDENAPVPLQPTGQRLTQLLEWMESQLEQPLSLTELESRSGLARRTLQQAFHERFGCGPMQWLRKRRLEQALAQLSNPRPEDSVSAVARRCGYLSLASFSRDFAEAYGHRASEVLHANRPMR
jgi:AraC-like DNA-binding protein